MSRYNKRRPTGRTTARKKADRRLRDVKFVFDVNNQPDGSATISGHHVAPGKTPLDLDAQTLAVRLDRDWFRSHPHRSHRIRRAIAGEAPGVPPGCYAAVRQVQPGLHLRRHFVPFVPLPEDEAPEHIAHALYDLFNQYEVVPGHELSERIRAYEMGGDTEPPSHGKPPVMH
jgi:hypothetical protein